MIDTASESAKFSNMGFICVCLVVLMHVHCPWEGGGINRLAVPFFFAMSGYFLAVHVDEQGWYARALSKRFRTLIIPLCIWCLIWAFFTIPLAIICNIHAGRELSSNIFTGWEMLRYLALDITNTPALGPLWYVRCLFLFVLVSPLIVCLIRRGGLLALFILGCLYYFYSLGGTLIRFLVFGFSLEGVFYFSLGMFFRMKHVPLALNPIIGAVMFCGGLLAYLNGLIVLSIALMIVGLWGVVPVRRFPRVLTSNTFPVYLLHMFVLVLFGNGKIASPLIAIGVGIVAIAVSVVIAELLRKLTPKFSTYIFGNR